MNRPTFFFSNRLHFRFSILFLMGISFMLSSSCMALGPTEEQARSSASRQNDIRSFLSDLWDTSSYSEYTLPVLKKVSSPCERIDGPVDPRTGAVLFMETHCTQQGPIVLNEHFSIGTVRTIVRSTSADLSSRLLFLDTLRARYEHPIVLSSTTTLTGYTCAFEHITSNTLPLRVLQCTRPYADHSLLQSWQLMLATADDQQPALFVHYNVERIRTSDISYLRPRLISGVARRNSIKR